MRINNILSYFDSFFRTHNYIKKGKMYYRFSDNIACCILFEQINNTLYCNYCVVPLYIPSNAMYLCYGNRIESLSDQSIQPLIYSQSDDVCISWIKVVLEFIEKRVFPFFKCVDSPDKLNDFLNFGFPSCKKYFSCTPEQYIRLLAFTNFVLGKKEEAVSYVAEAFHQLDVNSTISTTIIEKRKAELQHLLDLLSLSVDIQQEYIQETISNTLNNLFGFTL